MESQVPDKVVEAVTDVAPEGVRQQLREFFTTDLGHLVQIVLSVLLVVLLMVLIRNIAAHFLRRLEKRLRAQGNTSAALVGFCGHLLMGVIYICGAVSVLGVLSSTIGAVQDILNKLLAAGGIITVVAGLASQEALGSMVSGIMILVFKPFTLGDVVRYVDNDISGVVEEITVHHTTIRTWENKRVIVPNSKMNSAIIENADYADSKVCVFLDIGITYESDIERAKDLLSAEIEKHPSFFDYRTVDDRMNGAPPVVVRVVELADSAVVLRAWLWARDNGTAAVMKSDLLQSVKGAYDRAGIDIAYPHLVVVNK
ncbi:mechanosensitive ion channel family protein [Intestinibacillus massiliensis]|nr:mechanosensitive ion channel family protein [Intestinibacillus massiliensis]